MHGRVSLAGLTRFSMIRRSVFDAETACAATTHAGSLEAEDDLDQFVRPLKQRTSATQRKISWNSFPLRDIHNISTFSARSSA